MTRQLVILAFCALAAVSTAEALAKGGYGGGGNAPARKQTHDDIAAEYLQKLASTRNSQSDAEAVTSVKTLIGFWRDSDVTAQTKQPIPQLVGWYAKRKPTSVALAGINGLADIGKGQGTERLVHVLNSLLAQKDAPAELVAAAFTGLKSAADPDPSVTTSLLGHLANKDRKVALGAIDALAALGGAPFPDRKRLVESMLTSFESMAAASVKAADKDAVDRWTELTTPATDALNALTHQQFADLAAARKWFAGNAATPAAWK